MQRLNLSLKWAAAGMLLWGSAFFARAERASLEDLTGGGESASSGSLRLSGALGGFGLPGTTQGVSSSASTRLQNGFWPAVAHQVYRSGTDPVWLELDVALNGPEAPFGLQANLGPRALF